MGRQYKKVTPTRIVKNHTRKQNSLRLRSMMHLYERLTDKVLVTGAVDAVDALTGIYLLTAVASERVRAAAALKVAASAQKESQVQM